MEDLEGLAEDLKELESDFAYHCGMTKMEAAQAVFNVIEEENDFFELV